MSAIDNKWEILDDKQKAKAFADLAHYVAQRDRENGMLWTTIDQIVVTLDQFASGNMSGSDALDQIQRIVKEHDDAFTAR